MNDAVPDPRAGADAVRRRGRDGLLGELASLLDRRVAGGHRPPADGCARPRTRCASDLRSHGFEAHAVEVPDGEDAKTLRGRRVSAGTSWARSASPAPTRSSASAAERPPIWPAGSRRPGCAACGSCRCRRRSPAWSTPRSAARPGSTPSTARTWSARSTRRRACSATSPRWTPCREATTSPGSPRWSSAASSPTRRSSTSSRPIRRRRRSRASQPSASWSSGRSGSRPRWSATDLTEQGLREILNYGHTLGHAIERAERYRWRHGAAVSVGLVYAAALGRLLGRLDDATADRHGPSSPRWACPLPTARTPFRRLLDDDAGRQEGARHRLRFVVLDGLARPVVVDDPDPAVLVAAYSEVADALRVTAASWC